MVVQFQIQWLGTIVARVVIVVRSRSIAIVRSRSRSRCRCISRSSSIFIFISRSRSCRIVKSCHIFFYSEDDDIFALKGPKGSKTQRVFWPKAPAPQPCAGSTYTTRWRLLHPNKFSTTWIRTYDSCSLSGAAVVDRVMRAVEEGRFVACALHIVHCKGAVDWSKARLSCVLPIWVTEHPGQCFYQEL